MTCRASAAIVPTATPEVVLRGLEKKKSSAWSWILMDSSGQETMLDIDKYAIMRYLHIHSRDLRFIDPNLSYPSAIFARGRAIILNLEHVKAIITSEEVLIRDPLDEKVIPVVEELRRQLRPAVARREGNDANGSLFEFRALEVALEAISSHLSAHTTEFVLEAYPALDKLTTKISSLQLDRLLKLKSQITRMTARVHKVRDELERLLDDEDSMASLCLSRKIAIASTANTSGRGSVVTGHGTEVDTEEIEMLLEAYFNHIDDTYEQLTTLRTYIDNTEDYITIQLDNFRNQLIQLELFLSAGDVCLALWSLFTAIIGMSIPFSWNQGHSYLFKWAVIVPAITLAIIYLLIMAYARRKGLIGT